MAESDSVTKRAGVLKEEVVADRVAAAAQRIGLVVGTRAATEVKEMRRLPGGVSSLTYAAEIRSGDGAGSPVVIKVAPPGLEPVRNRDVLRQSRLMTAVRSTGALPVPRILIEDDGDPPLFVMDLVPGQAYEPLLDVAEVPPTPEVVQARALGAARALASFQGLDPSLGGSQEPPTELRSELDRWARLLDTAPEELAPEHSELYRRLASEVPSTVNPVLVHGDFRQANMIFEGSSLKAVIDWEIWSVGDPRLDLAWLLMHTDPAHRFAEERPAADEAAGSGMPTRESLLVAYQEGGGLAEPNSLAWFLGYSYYKVASTLAVIVKRNRKLEAPAEHLQVAERSLSEVISHGMTALDRR